LKKILFVCLGNICRSPSAEAVMNAKIKNLKFGNEIVTDSAGIIGWHSGEPADHRMQGHAKKRGYNLTSRSRRFNPAIDFDKFDYIIGMDHDNMRDLRALDPEEKYKDKIHLMTGFCQAIPADVVPDPYYGGAQGFETVLDILEDACDGLLIELKK
jgi:protein-tyrosine phosphatase